MQKNIKTIQEHSVSVICLSYENEKAPQIYNKTWNVLITVTTRPVVWTEG